MPRIKPRSSPPAPSPLNLPRLEAQLALLILDAPEYIIKAGSTFRLVRYDCWTGRHLQGGIPRRGL